jgi:hypothetical protein
MINITVKKEIENYFKEIVIEAINESKKNEEKPNIIQTSLTPGNSCKSLPLIPVKPYQ